MKFHLHTRGLSLPIRALRDRGRLSTEIVFKSDQWEEWRLAQEQLEPGAHVYVVGSSPKARVRRTRSGAWTVRRCEGAIRQTRYSTRALAKAVADRHGWNSTSHSMWVASSQHWFTDGGDTAHIGLVLVHAETCQ